MIVFGMSELVDFVIGGSIVLAILFVPAYFQK